MTESNGVLRRIAWKVICPWLLLFRVFSVAISAQVLFLATVGCVVVPLGWRLSEMVFVADDDRVTAPENVEFIADVEREAEEEEQQR